MLAQLRRRIVSSLSQGTLERGTCPPATALSRHFRNASDDSSMDGQQQSSRAAPASTPSSSNKEPESTLGRHLKRIIRYGDGPMTMAEYMQEVLTSPSQGYYMGRDVFGRRGDFITSPEVSQLFGDSVAVWVLWVWEALQRPERLQLVELGPGRGTLMADILRSTRKIGPFSRAVSVHMVEVSEALRKVQFETLRCKGPAPSDPAAEPATSDWTGAKVSWHRHLSEVPVDPTVPSIYLLHEFLDALPVHQFQRTPEGTWREVMIEVDDDPSTPLHFRRVLAPKPSPASHLLVNRRLRWLSEDERAKLQGLEVSAQCLFYAQELATRVSKHRGAALIVDYGKNGPYEASVQAIREHKGAPVLSQPGTADLSAWVDFAALRSAVQESPQDPSVSVEGPVPQGHFLLSLGIGHRLEQLLKRADTEQAKVLVEGARRLVEGTEDGEYQSAAGGGMGQAYQCLAIVSADVKAAAAAGSPISDSDKAASESDKNTAAATIPGFGLA